MTNPINVLYLSYTGMTDPLGQSQVLSYLKGLSATGKYRFTIISFEKAASYERLAKYIEDFCNASGIEWHPLSYTSKPPVLSTFRDVKRMRKLAETLHVNKQFALVHCRSYIPSLVGLSLKKKYGIPFLFDMRGFWADERIDGGIWKKSNPLFNFIYRYFKKKELEFLRNADHTVSLTQNAKDEILSWSWKKPPVITVIPCCADMDLFNPDDITKEQQDTLRQTLSIPAAAPVITYVGSLGTWYMLDEMLALVKQYQQQHPGAICLILTAEPEPMVRAAAIKAGIDAETLRVKKVLRREMPLYISISECSVFFIKPAFSKKASSPVKQGELMAMGIPVICNAGIGDTEAIVKKYDAGVVVSSFSGTALATAVSEVSHKIFDRRRIIDGAHAFYSLDRGVALYEEVYESIEKG
jgi:glycosyltransferase involved in cell wall biosynthesis